MELILYIIGYLYACWLTYILVMGMYRAHLARRLHGAAKVLAFPVVVVALLVDVLSNWFLAPVLFLDPPHEAMVTDRLKRYKREDHGWRGLLADLICDRLLDIFDPTGDHC